MDYYFEGGFGNVRVKEPLILGHEVAGTVTAVGRAVTRVKVGDRAAVNPNKPCGRCRPCRSGRANLCLDVRSYGSASRFPHVQGAFREELVTDESQIIVVPPAVTLAEAAFVEPLAVALHALTRAGSVAGRRILVAGCGPIGTLVTMAARHFGAREIVCTDIADGPLALAALTGADRTINIATHAELLTPYGADKGYFDVLVECSGSGTAVKQHLDLVRLGGTIVQLGLEGDVALPMNAIVAKEIELRGSFRFHEEFAWAAGFLAQGAIDVKPLLTETLPFTDAARAFALAADRRQVMKVQLDFD